MKAKKFSTFDWAVKMLKEIELHATEERCSRCEKLLDEMYTEVQEEKARKQ